VADSAQPQLLDWKLRNNKDDLPDNITFENRMLRKTSRIMCRTPTFKTFLQLVNSLVNFTPKNKTYSTEHSRDNQDVEF
jgi:hypothetical protein